MLIGQIEYEDKKYYLYNNENKLECVTVLSNGIVRKGLTKDVIEIFDIIRDKSYLKYLGKVNEYDVYLDTRNNYKRYFCNGIEDSRMFFSNNGTNAVMYSVRKNLGNVMSGIKEFIIGDDGMHPSFILASVLGIFVLLGGEIKFTDDYSEWKYYPFTQVEYVNGISESTGLTDEMKNMLLNDKFMKDFFARGFDESRQYELTQKFNNITVVEFTEEELKEESTTIGYYNPSQENVIHLKDTSTDIINSSLGHEFMHLVQDNNCYSYIREACAEILSKEYGFENSASSYESARQRVCVLMEIIGSEPVWECNFRGSTNYFSSVIYDSFEDKEDAKRLLQLFTKSPAHDKEELDVINKEIDQLLAKMYEYVYGTSIKEDELVQVIYSASDIKRGYFNDEYIYNCLEGWSNTMKLDVTMRMDDLAKDDDYIVIGTAFAVNDITLEDYVRYKDSGYSVFACYDSVNSMRYYVDEENNIVIDDLIANTYSIDEALSLGIVNLTYRLYEEYNNLSYDDTITYEESGYNISFDVTEKGNEAVHYSQYGLYVEGEGFVRFVDKSVDINYELIIDKFPEQFEYLESTEKTLN